MTDEVRQEPSYELINELYTWIQDYWKPQFDVDDEIWELLGDSYPIVTANTQDRKRLRRVQPERMASREGARVVDRISSLFSHPSSIGLQYSGPGSRSAGATDKAERGINEAIDSLNPPHDSPILQDRWNTVALGRCARLIVPGGQYYDAFPEDREDESTDDWNARYDEWEHMGPIPVVWKSLPPESTFPASFGRLGAEHLCWLDMPAFELKDMFSADELSPYYAQNREKNYGAEMVTLGIYANLDWLAYCLLPATQRGPTTRPAMTGGGVMLRSIEHKMGIPPVRILPGVTGGRKQPGIYWRSILYNVRELIKATDRRLSEAATASKFDSLPLMKMWNQEEIDEDGAAANDRSWLEGDVIPLKPGQSDGLDKEDIQPVYQPNFGDKTLNLVQWSLARIERMTGAVEALEGTFGPPGQPAWSRQHSVDQALRQLAPLTQAIVGQDLDAATTIIQALHVHGTNVTIKPKRGKPGPELTLKPDELVNYKPFLKAEYKAESATNRRADYDLGVSLMERVIRGGLAGPSPTRIMEEFMSIEQPVEEFKETMTWQFLLSPEIQAFMRKQLVTGAEADITADEGMGIEEIMKLVEEGRLPMEVAQGLIALAQPGGVQTDNANPFGAAADNNGNNPVGPTPSTVGAIRAGFPLQSTEGGPKPE